MRLITPSGAQLQPPTAPPPPWPPVRPPPQAAPAPPRPRPQPPARRRPPRRAAPRPRQPHATPPATRNPAGGARVRGRGRSVPAAPRSPALPPRHGLPVGRGAGHSPTGSSGASAARLGLPRRWRRRRARCEGDTQRPRRAGGQRPGNPPRRPGSPPARPRGRDRAGRPGLRLGPSQPFPAEETGQVARGGVGPRARTWYRS
ncbi:basic proline-rich protein-like [Caloenas nicobarica]|uniref:basic proline-rich protein-like n=1 Tax=Caloenas nicobarica TaxID=187106 RepID=UPI0032B80EF7